MKCNKLWMISLCLIGLNGNYPAGATVANVVASEAPPAPFEMAIETDDASAAANPNCSLLPEQQMQLERDISQAAALYFDLFGPVYSEADLLPNCIRGEGYSGSREPYSLDLESVADDINDTPSFGILGQCSGSALPNTLSLFCLNF